MYPFKYIEVFLDMKPALTVRQYIQTEMPPKDLHQNLFSQLRNGIIYTV